MIEEFRCLRRGIAFLDVRVPDAQPWARRLILSLMPALINSFPVEQSAIDAGKVLTWTKGFNAKGAIGNDVVKLLQDALDRKHIHVRVSALVNDVGFLLFRSVYTIERQARRILI